mmetsp:Transcript_62484/g.116112  ORF Transcript_62484/g.116112 Transcript_62484/m.116112 type:complete len:430 (-) Transcript_62484:96-1385(-)
MRNIALLEWGPTSLYYIKPREMIKVRTPWLEDGPVLPSWLATTIQAQEEGFVVRYALSAYEDLNSAIRNLRRCFGFPYQEYVGYLNTLSRTHRARREHEGLVDRLRRWAIFGNVDAVVWIDYAKANQPPGSFKDAPKDSRPFSPAHILMCQNAHADDTSEIESEGAWSESDPEFSTGIAFRPAAPPAGSSAAEPQQPSLSETGKVQTTSSVLVSSSPPTRVLSRSTSPRITILEKITQDKVLESSLRGFPQERSMQSGSVSSRSHNRSTTSGVQDGTSLRTMLQEEFVPAHGSIYVRSISPGPGYYGVPSLEQIQDSNKGCGFGMKPRGRIDETIAATRDKPGPGQYAPKPAYTDRKVPGGRFSQAVKAVDPLDKPRKLPFLSALAAKTENHSIFSPSEFHAVTPEAVSLSKGLRRPPQYSFGTMRRPF